MRFIRQALETATFPGLDASLRSALAAESSRLSRLRPLAPHLVNTASEEFFGGLKHELSAHFRMFNEDKGALNRSLGEARVLVSHENRGDELGLANGESFVGRLGVLNAALTDRPTLWRNTNIHLAPDRTGRQVQFPEAATIPAQLEKVRRILVDGRSEPAFFRGVVAMALLVNCHPFADGNGRVGRVLLNYALRQGGMPQGVYLPFYEMSRRSHGGYEIALRMAEIHGDWEPLLRFMLSVVKCHRALALQRPAAQ